MFQILPKQLLRNANRSKLYFTSGQLLTNHKAQIPTSIEYCGSHVWKSVPKHTLKVFASIQKRAVRKEVDRTLTLIPCRRWSILGWLGISVSTIDISSELAALVHSRASFTHCTRQYAVKIQKLV